MPFAVFGHVDTQSNLNVFSTSDTSRLRRKFGRQSFPLIILETKKDYKKDLRRLLSNGGGHDDCYLIIASSGKIKQTAERIKEITALIQKTPHSSQNSSKPLAAHSPKTKMSLSLGDLVEHKLRDFIQQMNRSGCRDLYPILLREIEPPLIRLTLAETHGNQIQAAQLLGINRNTLRKKIKDLKIPLGNKKHRRKYRKVSA